MAVLTDEMKNVLKVVGKGGAVVHLATSSADGKPNIVAERFVTYYKDQYILIAEMFAQKTKVNLNENPVGCISIAHPVKDHAWVFRGPCTIISHAAPDDEMWYDLVAGEVLNEWGDWAAKEPPDEVPPDIAPPKLAQRGVIALKVEEIYSFEADQAGQRIV
ncbi:pyridoxamine 5'-phosphate oxidase family protein [Sinanaerobacter chloroacetimidivorans]|jgi:predicted pyridoxine 5'-phosphate oxidase superfamily flavin-nucleotide-binding protein|uniref:Pyridoxamine 5'-phosphate oxidase family protein n=1 Tax=Sinanaerobacter chloroacetimidivorans TaxID=2818044 RepID=A0A8J7W1Y8_9FIRM|nr:pyridoxamine 5'-phosphate oxidase family protein [Sinanaerobacter chloroacetimidivorans]MBR0599384.1 pyridoxamine 5'-phosphate oxidase family protein [Sinanaerobacter chloroacetimidivorans]